MEGQLVKNRFLIVEEIGSGSFGKIYIAKDEKNGEEVAVKVEALNAKKEHLKQEKMLYERLRGGIGIPNVGYFGIEGNHSVLVMEVLGPSLEDLFCFCKRKFSIKTVLMIGIQIISRLEFLHKNHTVHRDVKPNNFLIGTNDKKNLVYMIDFGLSKLFRDPLTKAHIPYKDHKNLTGTARYASISTHQGVDQSRRDDLEGLGYVLLYFLRGSLPWQGIKEKDKKIRHEKIGKKKISTTIGALCQDLPVEFGLFLEYVRALKFDEEPNYGYLRSLFQDLFDRLGYVADNEYDWTIKQKSIGIESIPRKKNTKP